MAKFCCCVLPSNSIKISGNFCFLFMFCFDIYIDCLMLYFLSELFVVGIFVLIYRLHHAYCCVGRRGHVIIYIERPYGGSPGEILVLSNSAVLNFNCGDIRWLRMLQVSQRLLAVKNTAIKDRGDPIGVFKC